MLGNLLICLPDLKTYSLWIRNFELEMCVLAYFWSFLDELDQNPLDIACQPLPELGDFSGHDVILSCGIKWSQFVKLFPCYVF